MTTEELIEVAKAPVVVHLSQERLEAAMQRHVNETGIVDPPEDFMEKTQEEAEKLSD